MTPTTTVDWSNEIRLLRQLLPMATTVHVVAAEALFQQFGRLLRKPGAERKAKTLAIKLIAEAVSALEDFAALCRAVRLRNERGIIWAYLNYPVGEVRTVYHAIRESGSPWSYLRLFAPQEYVNNPDADNPNLILDLDVILGSAAKWYGAEEMIEVYNRTKHGFTVLEGPPGEKSPQPGDEDAIYVLCKDRRSIRLEDFRQWPERAKMVIDTCADGWLNLAKLIIFMHDRGYDLGLTPDPIA